MIRFSWYQFRAQAIGTAITLAAAAVVLFFTFMPLLHDFYSDTVLGCPGTCDNPTGELATTYHLFQLGLGFAVLALPALLGMFWGAPMVARELETGTYRLAWTQSQTRGRWLAGKLAVAGLAAMATTGLASLLVSWWSTRQDQISQNRFAPVMFGERGITPIGYAAFAFVLGVAASLLIRRTLPAMAATLVGYLGARLAVTYWIRPRLIAPVRLAGPADSLTHISQADWVLSTTEVTAAGRTLPTGDVVEFLGNRSGVTIPGAGRCPGVPASQSASGQAIQKAYNACIQHYGIRQVTIYQPISRYWPFQFAETAIFLAAAVALAVGCLWWVRHRLA